MIYSRHIRKLVAAFGAATLLFAQIAVAAHACAAVGTMEASATVAMQGGHDAAPCNEMNFEQPTLCFRHCQDGPQSLDHHQPPSLGFVATLVYYVEQPPGFTSATPSYSRALLARETAPPLSVRNCCFRT